jgi:hypothetical protein
MCSTISFVREVKPSVPCRKIIQHVKGLYVYARDICKQNSTIISRQVSPASLLVASAGNCQRALVEESEMIRAQIGTRHRSEMVAMQGSYCEP